MDFFCIFSVIPSSEAFLVSFLSTHVYVNIGLSLTIDIQCPRCAIYVKTDVSKRFWMESCQDAGFLLVWELK